MLERAIDPTKINLEEDCIEMNELFVGERVREGFEIKGFELAEIGEGEGIEVVGEFKDLLGIHVIVSGISEDSVQAIEGMFSEIINRMKGVEYRFRKENVRILVSQNAMEFFTPECVGKVIYDAVKEIPTVRSVKVRIICDEDEFNRVIEIARAIHKEREERLKKLKDGDVNTFYACLSCQVYLPNHACVITPERPSPCGTIYSEARAADELKIVHYYNPVNRGNVVDANAGEYEGVNEFIREKSNGTVERVKLHSALSFPPSTGNYAEAIVFYIPERGGFGIVDRSYKKKTPIGLTFSEIEKLIVGSQVEGFVGVSFAYLTSESFLKGDSGWRKVTWVSPKIYEFIMDFLPAEMLKNIETST